MRYKTTIRNYVNNNNRNYRDFFEEYEVDAYDENLLKKEKSSFFKFLIRLKIINRRAKRFVKSFF